MKSAQCLILLFTVMPLSSQQSAGGKYVSPDRSFELAVPAGYGIETGRQKPRLSYIPVCDDDSIVCVTYPENRYKGTTFGAASVEVTVVPAKTEKACLAPGGEFQIDRQNPSRIITGTRFLHSSTSEAAMSHDISTDAYRGYANGRCYLLAAQIAFTNFAVYPPGAIKEFTKQDQARVRSQLMQILDSFRPLPESH